MSSSLTARSPDLLRLRNEGFHLEVQDGYLLVHDAPYVNSDAVWSAERLRSAWI